MSFDPSSYSNSDLMTSSHSGQSDMPFDPSSYSNYDLMTSYHAQPDRPFNPNSYDNSNLMMSSIGPYSDIAQVKHVPYDPSKYQRRTAQHNSNALAWDEVREPDELDEPYSGFSSKPKSTHIFSYNNSECANPSGRNKVRTSTNCNKPYSMCTNNLSRSKNTHVFEQNNHSRSDIHMGMSDQHAEHMLSTKDRKSIEEINDPIITALMNKGDRHTESGNFKEEMLAHREAQDTLEKDYGIKHRSNDRESKKAFGYNSCMIHHPNYTGYYYSCGYKFDDIFKRKGSGGNYQMTKYTEYKKDPDAVKYINQSRAQDNRSQKHINNLDINSTKKCKKYRKKHKKTIN